MLLRVHFPASSLASFQTQVPESNWPLRSLQTVCMPPFPSLCNATAFVTRLDKRPDYLCNSCLTASKWSRAELRCPIISSIKVFELFDLASAPFFLVYIGHEISRLHLSRFNMSSYVNDRKNSLDVRSCRLSALKQSIKSVRCGFCICRVRRVKLLPVLKS